MRRNHESYRVYTSPGTPEQVLREWSSERVPLPASRTRRSVTAAALMPFNGGRTLPSKWDDAERWITSPLFRIPPVEPQRRLRSKSGPLGPSGLVYYSPTLLDGHVRSFTANSPLTTGVLVTKGVSVQYEGRINSLHVGNNMSDLVSEAEASAISCQGDVLEEKEVTVSCRDVATQMSPQGTSLRSSTEPRLSFSNGIPADRDEVRDVQVDRTTTTLTKRQELQTSTWDVTEQPSKSISKLQREESKITAWENLHKAKAEAAIKKLELKLEKKRSASMERIGRKLRGAEMKAQAMRNSLSGRRTRLFVNKCGFIRHCCLCTNTSCS